MCIHQRLILPLSMVYSILDINKGWFKIPPVSELLDLRKRTDIAVHREDSVGHNQPAMWLYIQKTTKHKLCFLMLVFHSISKDKLVIWKFGLDLERPSCDSCKPFSKSPMSLCLYLYKSWISSINRKQVILVSFCRNIHNLYFLDFVSLIPSMIEAWLSSSDRMTSWGWFCFKLPQIVKCTSGPQICSKSPALASKQEG